MSGCQLSFSLITSPQTYVYICLFIPCSVIAIAGNTIALFILYQPEMLSKSNRILRSLAVSDALIGYIMFPLLSYQMFHTEYLKDCTQQNIRQFLLYTLVGASAFTVALISYDRYILLTKLWDYDKHISHSKITLLICLSWLIPTVGVVLDLIGKLMNVIVLQHVTKVVKAVTIITVLLMIAFFYQHIVRGIKKMEKQPLRRTPSFRRYVLAKQVSVLVSCHIICFVPTLIGGILWYAKCCDAFTETSGFHSYLLFSTFIACFNSCINPIIYASRYQKFRKCLQKLVYTKLKQDTGLRSVTSNNRLAIVMRSMHNKVENHNECKDDNIPVQNSVKSNHCSQFATTPIADNIDTFGDVATTPIADSVDTFGNVATTPIADSVDTFEDVATTPIADSVDTFEDVATTPIADSVDTFEDVATTPIADSVDTFEDVATTPIDGNFDTCEDIGTTPTNDIVNTIDGETVAHVENGGYSHSGTTPEMYLSEPSGNNNIDKSDDDSKSVHVVVALSARVQKSDEIF